MLAAIYEENDKLCFICENASWRMAKPVLSKDCINLNTIKE